MTSMNYDHISKAERYALDRLVETGVAKITPEGTIIPLRRAVKKRNQNKRWRCDKYREIWWTRVFHQEMISKVPPEIRADFVKYLAEKYGWKGYRNRQTCSEFLDALGIHAE